MLDPTLKHFGYSQLRLIRPVCSHNRARLYVPDPTSYIQFSSVSPKKAWSILCKTDLHLIWMTWSASGQMHLVWKQVSVQGPKGLVSGRTQPARYQFPTFRLGCALPQMSRIILCETSPDPVQFWLTVSGFCQMCPVWKQACAQQSSSPFLANASKPIRSRCELDQACLVGQCYFAYYSWLMRDYC